MTAAPLRRVLAGGVAVLALASCTVGDDPAAAPTPVVVTVTPTPTATAVPDLTEESCQEIRREAAGAFQAVNEAVRDLGAAPEALDQVAKNLRAAAEEVGGELALAADELAAAVTDIAAGVRDGDLTPDLQSLQAPLSRVAALCRTP